jgi:hypothetical protein
MRSGFLLTIGSVLLACGSIDAQDSPKSTSNVITKMIEDSKQGFYEEAIRAGMSALENKPTDDVILRQIAVTYLMRADKDPEHSERWVKQAVVFADKSLTANPAIDIGRYEIARTFELAGDLAKDGKCSLYSRALKSVAEWSSTFKGNSINLEGKSVPVAFLIKQADETKSRIAGKQTQLHCE